ncbi:MAG TPA: HAD hydrolase-like protein [Anaerolineae bacterium]|nr:HAD hydrolase-like protein [Anaerolineae bacterium]
MEEKLLSIPGLGTIPDDAGMVALARTSDGVFTVGECGVESITATGDRKVEFVALADRSLALVNSQMGYPAYYPVHPAEMEKPLRAVLMDLDGTTVRSEHFWIWIIERTTASLLDDPGFKLEEEDFPYVSGHSVSEHLQHCIEKYAPDRTVEEARQLYFEHTNREMQAIVDGHGKQDAFVPSPGIKEFLLTLKEMGVKLGLVTSGLYEKAWPEILSAFRTLGLGDPREFYDAFITAGFPLRKGEVGTLGELEPKPHPWLYAEVGRVGLGIPFGERNRVVGIEDSGAGVCSIRLAGYPTIGIGGGNIVESGTRALCDYYCETFAEILEILR